ncbi:ubiquitin C-terminal hydrolase [Trifolium repens]|nr:ubiquitin C-terminal hydrolase [Trifolium repens]
MSSKINGQISPQPCPHLAEFRRTSSKPFLSLHNCLRIKPPGGRASLRRDPHEIPHCTACGLSAPSRLYACISCAAVSCHSTATGVISHATAHAASMSPGHQIAIDVDRAELFCCACRDQVYDRDFDAAVVIEQTVASTLGGGESTVIPTPHPENLRKRRRVDYRPSTPDLRERALIGSCSAPINGSGRSPDFPRGLRGLNNLGNTCFMNSVLQALLHTPPLRNYFLSDKHNRYFCQKMNNAVGDDSAIATTRKKSGGNNGNKNGRICLACDMDAMFSAVFSGDRLPYSPARFLHSWWQHAAKSHLASYEQQDAHEFFISMLDGIHEKVDKDQRKPHSEGRGFRSLACCPRS